MDYRLILLLVLVFSLVVSFQLVSAFKIIFPTLSYRADTPPTYCILTPESSVVPHYVKGRYLYLFQEAVYAWSAKLQESDPQNKILWEMHVEQIPRGESTKGKNCDIPVIFEYRDSVNPTFIGVFSSGYVDGSYTRLIKMYMDAYISSDGKC